MAELGEEYDEEEEEYEDYSSEKSGGEAMPPIKTDVESIEPQIKKVSIQTTEITRNGDIYSGTSTTQKQQAAIANTLKPFQLIQKQNGKPVRMPAIRSETIPDGFRGKIEEKKYHTKFLSTKHNNSTDDREILKPDTYVTVTKSISGSLDNSKTPPTEDKKFASTYYTKSSTCGYFTFSCNIVYGSNGRSKICRPKAPANAKC